MLTGLESIGNGQLPTGNFWTELEANLYRENKKNTGQAYICLGYGIHGLMFSVLLMLSHTCKQTAKWQQNK